MNTEAPLRIDIGGGVTDISPLSEHAGTCITNIGIDIYDGRVKRQLILHVVDPRKKGVLFYHNGTLHPLIMDSKDPLRLPKTIIHDFAQQHPANYRVDIFDNLPHNTGLGGSASLSICLHVGLYELLAHSHHQDYVPDPEKIIREAHNLEVDELGIAGGFQDFVGAYFGGLNRIDFDSLEHADLAHPSTLGTRIDLPMRHYLDNHMMVLLQKRDNISSGTIVQDEIDRYKQNPRGENTMLDEFIKENKRLYHLLTQPGDLSSRLTQIGLSMLDTWEMQKRLSPLVSNRLLQQLEDRVKPYCYGLRGPGAGGNSLFLLTQPNSKKNIYEQLLPFYDDIEILIAKVNERGVRQSKRHTPDFSAATLYQN